MSFFKPGSKSVATITARTLRAWAHDLENVASGLQQAAEKYESGLYDDGDALAKGSVGLTAAVYRSMRDKLQKVLRR